MESNYLVRSYTYDQLQGNVALPSFQRSLVWNKDRKKNFIKTVLSKNPFGVLLIYQNPETHKQQIIDGLQRFTTLKEFEKKPLEYLDILFDDRKPFEAIIKLILNEYNSSTYEHISNQIQNSIKKLFKTYTISELNTDRRFINELRISIFSTYSQLEDTATGSLIRDEIYSLWMELVEELSIHKINIPIILYQGSADELPGIFERLNTGGTSLTKYEVFASTWSDVILKHVDISVAKIIEKRYSEVMEKTGMQIDNYNDGDILANREITLYEYCFALGKLIKEKAPLLFGNKRSVSYDSVDSIGFSTLVTFLGSHLKKMSQLDKKINSKINPRILNRLTEKIISVYTNLEEILKYHTSIYGKYIESQVISMAYTLFSIKYKIDIETLEITDKNNYLQDLKDFTENVAYRMFYDILRNFWSGSGDNKLFEILETPLDNNKYLIPVPEESYRALLIEWMNDMLDKPSKTINQESKLFLSFINSPIVNKVNDYSIANIIPKQILKDKMISLGVNHVANLYWIPKDKVFSQFKNELIYLKIRINKLSEIPNFPLDSDFPKLDSSFYDIEYRTFLENHSRILINTFLTQK